VPKKGGLTVVKNENNELIPQRTVTGWQMCINYRKLNKATKKDHFPLPFIDEMLERLANHAYFCFLDGYSGFMQIPIHPDDQHKTMFTCPYGTSAYRRMPFGLCNASTSFQHCMMVVFSEFIEEIVEVFMYDFNVYGKTFMDCLANLDKFLTRCAEVDLVLNWEKCHFMVKLLTPKIGTGEGLICGPDSVTDPVQQEKIASEDSAGMLAVGSLSLFGKRTVCADFAGSRGDVARMEGTNGWISIRTWALNEVSNIVLVVHQESC
jgi:hypothetical protein